jgi:predicted RNA methylase
MNPTQKPRKLWAYLLGTWMPVPGRAPEAEELLDTEGVEGQFTPIVLDLTSGSGSLTVACAEAGYSSVAYEADSKQVLASAKILKKYFMAGSFFSTELGFNAMEEEEDYEDRAVVRHLQGAFNQALQEGSDEI